MDGVGPRQARTGPGADGLASDRALVMLASLACCADGACTHDEDEWARRLLAGPLRRLGDHGRQDVLAELRGRLLRGGVAEALRGIRAALPPARHGRAFQLSATLARLGGLTRDEADHVADVAIALGLGDDDVARLLSKPLRDGPAGLPPARR